MTNTKKRGFTIVSLILVILLIAILAAILIPTFIKLNKTAKLSADEQAVTSMNTVLIKNEALNGKPSTVDAAKQILSDSGFNMPASPITAGYSFYWIKADNRVVLVKMNGESPEKITYTKDLAKKYATLPADDEWFPLGADKGTPVIPPECTHEDTSREYIPLADANGGSTQHIIICQTCNEKLGIENHIDQDDDGKCDLCGWGDRTEPHVHAYTITSNNDGTHTKTCICGQNITESCRFDANGICSLCGYKKPVAPHVHSFTYTSNNNGTHNKKCSGCSEKDKINEFCTYDANGRCIYCNYQKPQVTAWTYENGILKKNGIPYTGVNHSNLAEPGLYYNEGLIYTGEAGGYSFKNGMLIVNYTTNAAEDDGTIFHYTLENIGEDFLTNKVVLNTDSMSEYISGNAFMGNAVSGIGFDITNKLNKNFVISKISATSLVGKGLKYGFTDAEIASLREANALPKITNSDVFLAYLESIKDLNGGTRPTAAQYVDLYNSGKLSGRTFTLYLKKSFGLAENDKLTSIYSDNAKFQKLVQDRINYDFGRQCPYWCESKTENGFLAGKTQDVSHVEPELIEFIFDIQYHHSIAFTFHKDKSSVDSESNSNDIIALYNSINGNDQKIYQKQGASWIDSVNSSNTFTSKLYKYADLEAGNIPTNLFTTSNNGTVISGSIWMWWHQYLATNAYNNVADDIPLIEIILSIKE